MEFSVRKSDFLNRLYLASGIADRKNTVQPILSNVMLRSKGEDRIVCTATDLTVAVSAEVPARVCKEGGLTLRAHFLHDIIKGIPGEEVTLAGDENDWCLVCSDKVQYRIAGLPDREFPRIPDHSEVEFRPMSATLMDKMIRCTIFAIAADESRYHLSGALLQSDGETMCMVATDGHRLSKVECSVKTGVIPGRGVLIPRKGLCEIRRALEVALDGGDDHVGIGFRADNVFVRMGDAVLSVKLIDAQFPPYERIIPRDADKRVTLSRSALLESLRRVSLVTEGRTRTVKLLLENGALRISSDNPTVGEAREEVAADYSGGPLEIGFNSAYITEFLAELDDDEVALELRGSLDPGVVRSLSCLEDLCVMMPMRL